METKFKTELVRVSYWTCMDADHRHREKHTAVKCICDSERRKAFRAGAKAWTRDALADVLKQHENGKRACDLARELDLSPSRVKQILDQAVRQKNGSAPADPFDQLSTRTRNALFSEAAYSGMSGMIRVGARPSTADVKEWLVSGRLRAIPNIGRVGWKEVENWLAGIAT